MNVKSIFLGGITVALAIIMNSCDSKAEMAKNLEGTWASNVVPVEIPNTLSATALYMMNFTPQNGVADPVKGDFKTSVLINVVTMAPQSDLIVQPYSVSASAIASIDGTWKATEDDEVMLSLDPSTIKVKVDPSDVVLSDNILSGENEASADTISTVLAQHVKNLVTNTYRRKFLMFNKIEDIKIKKNEMKCEINDRDYMFSRQSDTVMEMNK